jgi:hypothetical protein
MSIDSGNTFRVQWTNTTTDADADADTDAHAHGGGGDNSSGGTLFPTAATNCSSACAVHQGTCVCEVEVEVQPVFTDASTPPSAADADAGLTIGSPPPAHFGDGVYTVCNTTACAGSADVTIYTRGTAAAPLFDERAIFVIAPSGGNRSRLRFLANKVSVVRVAGGRFSFRNPPKFVSVLFPTQRDAEHETEALLDHLFYHRNVAPFIGRRLIQRLTTSNPSPRYVAAVSAAFISGVYSGVGSGAYGDMAATVAAIMLDREAGARLNQPVLVACACLQPSLCPSRTARCLLLRTRRCCTAARTCPSLHVFRCCSTSVTRTHACSPRCVQDLVPEPARMRLCLQFRHKQRES